MTEVENPKERKSLALPQKLLSWKTPPPHIHTRIARGGQLVPYVTHTYSTELLNTLLKFRWGFEIIKDEILYYPIEGQSLPVEVRVLARLTVLSDPPIVKQQFGAESVKYYTHQVISKLTGKMVDKPDYSRPPISLGDDFKAAGSDALKKCASLLGICLDVYKIKEERELEK